MITSVHPQVEYPENDGNPLSDNTLQFHYITTIQGGLDALFADDPNVFVAGDLLWYPIEGNNQVRVAPDTMVVLGRPKGYRGSYKQWEEGGIGPQVVFEIASPSNSIKELQETKLAFYDRHQVEEYYLFDPDRLLLKGWQRGEGGALVEIVPMQHWVSPRLGVRFELTAEGELQLYTPTGERFASYVEAIAEKQQAWAQVTLERQRAARAEAAQLNAIAPLVALGLDAEAIASILSLPLDLVRSHLEETNPGATKGKL
ncbi:MAG: Uma2 family endonuclease [Spirulina sp. DLM2.Bin59]|nr:MAG: Uma2 family endonuclease [Spirulina sp. DLM2.Bin59]